MKKTLYLIIALMLAVGITGCSSESKDTVKETEKTEKTEKAEKKEEKKETKKEEKKESGKSSTSADDILTCEMESESYNGTAELSWIEDSLNQIDFVINVPINNENLTDELFDTTVELTKQMMEAQFGINEETEGITLKTTSNKEAKTITFNISIDLTKASKDNLSKLGFNLSEEDLKSDIDDIKAEMEKSGFACKKKYN